MGHHKAAVAAQRRAEVYKAPPLSPLSTKPRLSSSMNRGIFGVFMLALLAVGMIVGVAPSWVYMLGTSGFVRAPSINVDDDDDGLSSQVNFAKMNYFGGRRTSDVTPWLGRGYHLEHSQKSAHLMVDLIATERLTMWTSFEGFGADNFVAFIDAKDSRANGTCWVERR